MNSKLFYFFLLGISFAHCQSKLTEVWEPVPEKIEAYNFSQPPSDAIILFDGTDFSNWVTWGNKEPKWIINKDGSMTVVNGKGSIQTKESFGSVQLHIEWKTGTDDLDKHKKPK
mgnify:FL=1